MAVVAVGEGVSGDVDVEGAGVGFGVWRSVGLLCGKYFPKVACVLYGLLVVDCDGDGGLLVGTIGPDGGGEK